jgi:2-methylisocitrate lyase-like PEP mutase family enzyme
MEMETDCGSPVFSIQELEDMGYKMVNHAVGAVLVNFKATKDMFTHLKETGKSRMDPAVYRPVRKEVEEASGFSGIYRVEKETTEKG